jgi:hypothetical protein
VAEHQLPKLSVEGSIPFARSIFFEESGPGWALFQGNLAIYVAPAPGAIIPLVFGS